MFVYHLSILYNYHFSKYIYICQILEVKIYVTSFVPHHVKGAGHPLLDVLLTRIKTQLRIRFTALLCSHGNCYFLIYWTKLTLLANGEGVKPISFLFTTISLVAVHTPCNLTRSRGGKIILTGPVPDMTKARRLMYQAHNCSPSIYRKRR